MLERGRDDRIWDAGLGIVKDVMVEPDGSLTNETSVRHVQGL
jgi:hypothetical protein